MTALAKIPTVTRFRHYDDETNDIYVGEIETEHDGITILSCWRFNMTTEQVYPYDRKFPALLRAAIEQTAIEQRFSPPATPIELPSDWYDDISIVSTETTYEIETKLRLPTVMSDFFRERVGLRAVRRIAPTTSNAYRVTVRGSFAEMQRELRRAAALTA